MIARAFSPKFLNCVGAAMSVVVGAIIFTACAPEEDHFIATMTSDVVQRDTCRVQGDDDRELCVKDEQLQRLTVSIVETDNDRVWISGITLEGETDRRLLGTRDNEGGFLFVDKTTESNTITACTFVRVVELSLRLPDDVSEASAQEDICTPLIGRETRTFTTSVECDDINEPAVEISRINRRRWEPALDCESTSPTTTDNAE